MHSWLTKKIGKAVSRVLSSPIIYLGGASLRRSSNLPPGMGRATLIAPVYMVLQATVRTAGGVATAAVGFYPAFSPVPCAKRVGAGWFVFCYAVHALTNIYPLGSVALCLARTFLSHSCEWQR